MRSYPRAGRALRSIMLSAMLVGGLSACVTQQRTSRAASACSALVPEGWKAGIPSLPPPAQDTAGAWIVFADGQTGQLDKANGRTTDTIEIIERCEKRDAEAVAQIEAPWWAFWRR